MRYNDESKDTSLDKIMTHISYICNVVVKCLKISVNCESANIKNINRRNRSGFYSLTPGHLSYIYIYIYIYTINNHQIVTLQQIYVHYSSVPKCSLQNIAFELEGS